MKKIHLIGNAHLDPVWLWRWQEGFAEIKATFRSALDRMKEFPEYVFTCACASYYKWVEENDPEMFVEIQERVKSGQWVIVGGWWIQPDCNIPAGESFARHALYSQRYFLEKFGVQAKVGYNVDSFGHNGMLPQILKKSGMDYYVFMRPGDHEKDLPGNLFWWESMDGSRVLAYKIPFSYGNWSSSDGVDPLLTKLHATIEMSEAQNIPLMTFFGVGNHGGGPTIANLLTLREAQEDLGKDRIVFSDPNTYFMDVEQEAADLPVIKEDLQHHASGCYSTLSEVKANNRKAEHRLLSAEKFGMVASRIAGYHVNKQLLQRAWQDVLFNQFHDIMGGCSIQEAYTDAREFYGEALKIGGEILNGALQKISWAIDTMGQEAFYLSKDKDWLLWEHERRGAPVVVFNPLSWDVEAAIEMPKLVAGVIDEQDQPVTLQKIRAAQTNGSDKWSTLFTQTIPAMGYRVFKAFKETEYPPTEDAHMLSAGHIFLENDWLYLEVEPHTGYLKKFVDKQAGREILASCGAVPVVIDEQDSDTWAHGIFSFRREVARFTDASVKLIEEGPLRATLRVISRYNQSTLRQDFILYRNRKSVEVRVKLDWREQHKMLKLSFPVQVANPKATYEIPYGFIEKKPDGQEEAGQAWVDVTGDLPDGASYGLALTNDSKYSYDILENDLRLTMVRSPIYADHFGERDEFCEFMDQGIQYLKYELIPHAGDWRQASVPQKACELNVLATTVLETYHKGSLPSFYRGLEFSSSHIIATVLKEAEDGEGWILRCYETNGEKVTTNIQLPVLEVSWNATFQPCEIKTFRIQPDRKIFEVNLIEQGSTCIL